ncbi:hypothetical protein R1sor_022969 [Riccia sorocarpa]|uniref:DUF7803 domain-containing protein n=1 Tax=Riccia sorocarpa TaxID=122646 RepID=A0ABD3GLC9_9MARC
MDTDAQEQIEEVILTGDDLMTGPPSPLIPADIAPHVLSGMELCSANLRKLFECLHKNDIEPFCQDEILMYRRCAQARDTALRDKLYDTEEALGRRIPESEVEERLKKLKSDAELLERRFILASGLEGIEGLRQRWSLSGQLHDTTKRIERLELGLARRKEEEEPQPVLAPSRRRSCLDRSVYTKAEDKHTRLCIRAQYLREILRQVPASRKIGPTDSVHRYVSEFDAFRGLRRRSPSNGGN